MAATFIENINCSFNKVIQDLSLHFLQIILDFYCIFFIITMMMYVNNFLYLQIIISYSNLQYLNFCNALNTLLLFSKVIFLTVAY